MRIFTEVYVLNIVDMTSHELAKQLLEGPNLDVCMLSIERKRFIKPIIGLAEFNAIKDNRRKMVILFESQKVDGTLYWMGDDIYVPKGSQYNRTNHVRR